jgi:hypothetical protein
MINAPKPVEPAAEIPQVLAVRPTAAAVALDCARDRIARLSGVGR